MWVPISKWLKHRNTVRTTENSYKKNQIGFNFLGSRGIKQTFGALFVSYFTNNLGKNSPKTFGFGQPRPKFLPKIPKLWDWPGAPLPPLMENTQIKAAFLL